MRHQKLAFYIYRTATDNIGRKEEGAMRPSPFPRGDIDLANAAFVSGHAYLTGLVAPDHNVDVNVSQTTLGKQTTLAWQAFDHYCIVLVCTGKLTLYTAGHEVVLTPGQATVIRQAYFRIKCVDGCQYLMITSGHRHWKVRKDDSNG